MRNAVHASHSNSDPVLLLALQRMSFLGADERRLLLDTLRNADDLVRTEAGELKLLVGRDIPREAWNPLSLLEGASRDMELLERRGIRYLHCDNPEFPPLLRLIHRPPFGLYVRGRLPDPCRPCVAIVGTRKATRVGIMAAASLAAQISAEGIPVVSGLARGIDSAAHSAAARKAGATCAVLPSGPDCVYPPQNRPLAVLILETGGCLLTEYPPGSAVHKYRFPDRNRLIAGLARSCVVVEAPLRSGALITADHALAEGRDVFVHPDCLGGPRNAGADALNMQGANPVGSADELFNEWNSVPVPGGDPAGGTSRATCEAATGRGSIRAAMDELRRELCAGPEAAGNKESTYNGH